jgi:hypothetical protein
MRSNNYFEVMDLKLRTAEKLKDGYAVADCPTKLRLAKAGTAGKSKNRNGAAEVF